MNLKEAFTYQNKLKSLMCEAETILIDDENLTVTKKTYFKHKVVPEAKDETVFRARECEYADRITDVAKFFAFLLDERAKLSAAITATKRSLDIDLDSEVDLNSARRDIAGVFRRMNQLRNREETVQNGGTAFRFNADGNEVPYKCDVKSVTTINFDRNYVRSQLEKLRQTADETSAKIDLCLVTSNVEYKPPFDVNSSFAEAFESFAGA